MRTREILSPDAAEGVSKLAELNISTRRVARDLSLLPRTFLHLVHYKFLPTQVQWDLETLNARLAQLCNEGFPTPIRRSQFKPLPHVHAIWRDVEEGPPHLHARWRYRHVSRKFSGPYGSAPMFTEWLAEERSLAAQREAKEPPLPDIRSPTGPTKQPVRVVHFRAKSESSEQNQSATAVVDNILRWGDLLTPDQAAAAIDHMVTVETLANWRSQRRGPPYVVVGRAVRYPANLLAGWLKGYLVVCDTTAD